MMAQYTVTIAGAYTIEVLINGKEIYGSPYRVLAIPGPIEAYPLPSPPHHTLT